MIVYLNGAWLRDDEAHVSIQDRGFLSGDGVFETARLHRGAYFRLFQHLDRLAGGAEILGIAPPAPVILAAVASELAFRNHLEEGTLRITLTRGVPGDAPTVLATLQPIASDWERRAARGWRIVTAKTRRPSIDSVPAALKSTARIYSVLARLEERPENVDDVLLLSERGYVCEGPAWNIFWRRGNVLRTPSAATGALAGVTRSVIQELAPAAGFTVEEGEFPPEDLHTADEAFATMSSVGVVAIRALDERAFTSDAAARLLHARYWSFVAREVTAGWGTEPA